VKPDDLIIQEFQKGYFLNDTIIRHSKVMIAKHVDEKKDDFILRLILISRVF